MSISPSFCGMCDSRHFSKPSEVWCSDCEEGLCTECLEQHSVAKPCRNHTTIPISEYLKLPSYVLEINELCNEHHEKFNLYCKEHERPCCRICNLENHKDCKEVTILENIMKNVKTSNMFNEIEGLIDESIETISKIRLNRVANAIAVKEQKILVQNKIRELRTKIDMHLDKLQESMMKELTEKEKGKTEQTRELLVTLDEKQKEMTEHQTNIVNIKKYATELQTFLAVKQIEKDIKRQYRCLQSIVNSDSLNQTKLSYKIDSRQRLKTITGSIQKFGEVIVESMPCELTFVRKKDKQTLMMVADLSPPMSVENIQLKLKQKIKIKGSLMRGCSFLPDGRMVFSSNNADTVSFINKEGVDLFQIGKDKTGFETFDTVYIKDNNTVAVSSGHKRCITIIDIESKKVMKTISMDTAIYGVAIRGRTIYYCTWDEGLKMLNLSDRSVSDIINSHKSKVYYVATSGDKVYYTDWSTNTVTCCNLHGTTQWKFTDERVLRGSVGISVDNDGNVYVVGCSSNNVVVISPDGQRHRQLLSSKDGLVTPYVLDYDKSTNRLLVVNNGQSAFLFDVTRG